MDKDLEKFFDDSVREWIDQNKEMLETMYETYVNEADDPVCSYDEFSLYIFYENSH